MSDRIAEIRARLALATPGPWAVDAEQLDEYGFNFAPTVCAGCGGDWPLDGPDAFFIAYAREDVPWLLAEIERLRGEQVTHDDIANELFNAVITTDMAKFRNVHTSPADEAPNAFLAGAEWVFKNYNVTRKPDDSAE